MVYVQGDNDHQLQKLSIGILSLEQYLENGIIDIGTNLAMTDDHLPIY